MSTHLPKAVKERPQLPKSIGKIDSLKGLEETPPISQLEDSLSLAPLISSKASISEESDWRPFDSNRMSPPPKLEEDRSSPSLAKLLKKGQPEFANRAVSAPGSISSPHSFGHTKSDFGHSKTDATGAFTPHASLSGTLTSPRHPQRRFWPKDARGLLELCEQGYQLQQGMSDKCKDTKDALEHLVELCDHTVRGMLTKLEETCNVIQREAERPANVDWSPIYKEFADKISPCIINSLVASQKETVVRFEDEMTAQLARVVEKVNGSIDKADEAQKDEMLKLRREISEAQKEASEFEQVTTRSQERMMTLLNEQHQTTQVFIKTTLEEVKNVVEESKQRICGFEPLVEDQLGRQLADIRENELENRSHIKEIHQTVHTDIDELFYEIGTLQKVMHVPHMVCKQDKRCMREGYREREFWTQTDPGDTKEDSTQTDLSITQPVDPTRKKKDGEKKKFHALPKAMAAIQEKKMGGNNPLMADDESKKKKMREQLIKPQYNVADYYYDKGCAQMIAKHPMFENLTFFIILLNAIWIAVDADNNSAPLISQADFIFQVVENSFCGYFTFELFIRFLAFRKKKHCLKDFWFVFDAFLVAGMIGELWVLVAVLELSGSSLLSGSNAANLSLLRIARLVKIFRMARMARLLRSVPELVMIMKGMGVAFRSVSFFVLLALIVVYVFAVAFRQLTKDSDVGNTHFATVPRSMGYLLLEGMLPLYAPIVNTVSNGKPWLWPVIMVFVLLASITILNMLIGVLTEVVRTVAATEKDAMTVTHVTQQLRSVMGEFQSSQLADAAPMVHRGSFRGGRKSLANGVTKFFGGELTNGSDVRVTKKEFEDFLLKPEVMKIITDVGVDVPGLVDMADVVYEDKDKDGSGLSFVDFIDVVLNLRGSNPATVKDIKEMSRMFKGDLINHRERLQKFLLKEIEEMRMDLVNHLVNIMHRDSDSEDDEYGLTSKRTHLTERGTHRDTGKNRRILAQADTSDLNVLPHSDSDLQENSDDSG